MWREVRTLRLLASEATLDLGAQRGRKPGSQHGQKAIYHLATEAEARKARHHQRVVAPERDLSAESERSDERERRERRRTEKSTGRTVMKLRSLMRSPKALTPRSSPADASSACGQSGDHVRATQARTEDENLHPGASNARPARLRPCPQIKLIGFVRISENFLH